MYQLLLVYNYYCDNCGINIKREIYQVLRKVGQGHSSFSTPHNWWQRCTCTCTLSTFMTLPRAKSSGLSVGLERLLSRSFSRIIAEFQQGPSAVWATLEFRYKLVFAVFEQEHRVIHTYAIQFERNFCGDSENEHGSSISIISMSYTAWFEQSQIWAGFYRGVLAANLHNP